MGFGSERGLSVGVSPITRGFVLAGGLSRRYGSDKALVDEDGVPAVIARARVLEAAGLSVGIVARAVRPELEPFGVPELLEPDVDFRHPLVGLAAIGGDDDVFVCPCDATKLAVDQVIALCQARALSTDSPLCGVWSAELRQRAGEWAARGGAVRGLVAGVTLLDVGEIGNRNERPPKPAPSA